MGCALAMSSNILLACRSVFTKLLAKQIGTKISYTDICTSGAVVLFIPVLYSGDSLSLFYTKENLIATVCHICYCECSFAVLNLVAPLSHSMIKVFSRLIIIGSTIFFYKYEVTVFKALSLSMALAGLIFYVKNKPSGTILEHRTPKKISLFFVILLALSTVGGPYLISNLLEHSLYNRCVFS